VRCAVLSLSLSLVVLGELFVAEFCRLLSSRFSFFLPRKKALNPDCLTEIEKEESLPKAKKSRSQSRNF
jgi:hypothetical protein